ncbi:mucolipin-3-like [Ruditapes philippinarum]|uniref:mucolipin-3-like n=1 Tax=Ruditapes philippinarum TaxID=129788 RepID=UPI00295B0092|nr:mucolipin-3-like [Ruditapes philippinarum]
MNLSLSDWQLETSSDGLEALVIAFSIISLLLSISTMIFAAYTFWRTKQFMKEYFQAYFGVEVNDNAETDLPVSEYFRFLKFWDATVVISDILTLYGTVRIAFHTVHSEWVLGLLDSYAVWLGVGCVIAWLSLLRFFKFHNKFHLLFNTLYKAFWNVVAYLICVGVLFVGFWVCGYVVMAPYHVKFKTPAAAAETLFAVVYGDEIYATLAILESDKSGGNWVWWFSRFYLGTYIAIYTVVVINLLIALFMSAYESIKAYYEQKPEERELGPMEKALVRALIQDDEGSNFLRSWIYCLMNDSTSQIQELNSLKTEFSKFVRVSKSEKNVKLLKPRTLKVFMEDEEHERKNFKCGFMSCSFTFSGDDQTPSKQKKQNVNNEINTPAL